MDAAPRQIASSTRNFFSRLLAYATLTAAIIICIAWGFDAVSSFPIIVPADSDLGTGAMQRVRDAGTMFLCSLVVSVLAIHIVSWARLRIVLAVLMLIILASLSFESRTLSQTVRWPSLAILGLTIVNAFSEGSRNRGLPISLVSLCGLSMVLPSLILLADWRGRICLGLMPSDTIPRSSQVERLRKSVGLLERGKASLAESQLSELRATGGEDGVLTVQRLKGGPAFQVSAGGPQHSLDELCFSPDGRTLAVADNNWMDRQGVITVWDITAGDDRMPPKVARRHTLRGHTHRTYSLDFFPDGRTLVSANADNTVRIWDTVNGKEMENFIPHRHPKGYWDISVGCVATAPDGVTFATWSWDSIKLWDRESLRLLCVLDAREELSRWMAFTEDGQYLFAANRNVTHRWELRPNWLPFLGIATAAAALIVGLFLALFASKSRRDVGRARSTLNYSFSSDKTAPTPTSGA